MEIDRSAVYNGAQVFIVEDDSVLKVKSINTKRLNSKTVVFSGLEEGEELVIEQLINAHNNMIVTIKIDSSQSQKPSEVASGKN